MWNITATGQVHNSKGLPCQRTTVRHMVSSMYQVSYYFYLRHCHSQLAQTCRQHSHSKIEIHLQTITLTFVAPLCFVMAVPFLAGVNDRFSMVSAALGLGRPIRISTVQSESRLPPGCLIYLVNSPGNLTRLDSRLTIRAGVVITWETELMFMLPLPDGSMHPDSGTYRTDYWIYSDSTWCCSRDANWMGPTRWRHAGYDTVDLVSDSMLCVPRDLNGRYVIVTDWRNGNTMLRTDWRL